MTENAIARQIVEDKVIVEIKPVETLAPVHKKQLLTYLRLADMRLGSLINFNVVLIKDGITQSRKARKVEQLSQATGSRRFEVEDLASRSAQVRARRK